MSYDLCALSWDPSNLSHKETPACQRDVSVLGLMGELEGGILMGFRGAVAITPHERAAQSPPTWLRSERQRSREGVFVLNGIKGKGNNNNKHKFMV